jgi:hypothetical protein
MRCADSGCFNFIVFSSAWHALRQYVGIDMKQIVVLITARPPPNGKCFLTNLTTVKNTFSAIVALSFADQSTLIDLAQAAIAVSE